MTIETPEDPVQPEVPAETVPKKSPWRSVLTTVGLIVLLLCVCIAVLTLLGPAISRPMNTLLGIPNGAPE